MLTLTDWDDEPAQIQLRGHQPAWLETILSDLETHTRILVVAPGGVGKTTLFAALAARMWAKGIHTLVLENRDRLTRQTANRIRKETGLECDVEMGADHASPFTPIVVACTATLGRENRLTGFSPDHFGLIVPDEAHYSMAPQQQRVLRYFHYGAESIAPDYIPPEDGTYTPLGKIVGFTATPHIGERRSLAEFYQPVVRNGQPGWSVDYSYLNAVEDGWLVRPVQKNIPIKVDLRKFKTAGTPTGVDFNSTDLSRALIPVIEELADQHALYARNKKAMAFLPSVECAVMMTEALNRRGLTAYVVSGEHLDTEENTERFIASGPGTTLCNAVIYNAGVDFPDVDCIGWYRATLSRAFYIQGIYRGTRVLPGVIDGIDTAEGRRAAIAASTKPYLLILDPLFVSDRIDLLDAYDLFTDKPEVKEKMKESGDLTTESAEKANRDFLKALEKEARKHARKASRTIDPLAFSLMVGDDALAHYAPATERDRRPPTTAQAQLLARMKVDMTRVQNFGYADKLIGRLLARHKAKMATYHQMQFLKQLGLPEERAMMLTQDEATATIDSMKRRVG